MHAPQQTHELPEPPKACSMQRACSVTACHCGGALAEYIVGPLENGKEYDASEKCALLHVMAGYRSRKRQNDKALAPDGPQ